MKSIASAFIAASAEMPHVPTSGENDYYGSSFSTWADFVDTVRPILAKHGLGFVQFVAPDKDGAIVRTRLLHESGEYLDDDGVFIPARASVDKITGEVQAAGSSAFTAAIRTARRMSLATLLGLVDDTTTSSAPPRQSHSFGSAPAGAAADRGTSDDPVLRFGRDKGKRVSAASVENLRWVLDKLDTTHPDFGEQNAKLAKIIQSELATRVAAEVSA